MIVVYILLILNQSLPETLRIYLLELNVNTWKTVESTHFNKVSILPFIEEPLCWSENRYTKAQKVTVMTF